MCAVLISIYLCYMINFSESCERNKRAIAEVLSPQFSTAKSVLEIGSYSGQHAIHFCQNFSHLVWQASDVAENIDALIQNLNNSKLDNFPEPKILSVLEESHWPKQQFDLIYTANTLHIMSWQAVKSFFKFLPQVSRPGTLLCIYGPFKYGGEYSSKSNADFQVWLQERNIESGIRDFEQVNELAEHQGYTFRFDHNMPANNQLLIWQKFS